MTVVRSNGAKIAVLLPSGKFKTPQSVRDYANSLAGRLKNIVKGAKVSAAQKDVAFNIDYEHVVSLWADQGGKCPYTGWDMTTESNSKMLVSIERKVPSKGYTKGNCILVNWSANRAKNIMEHKDFIEMCCAIADTHRSFKFND